MNKTCNTCDRREGDMCMANGFFVEVERKFPGMTNACGPHYLHWVPRRGVTQRVREWWFGVDPSKGQR